MNRSSRPSVETVLLAGLLGGLGLLAAVSLRAAFRTPNPFSVRSSLVVPACGVHCGTERWAVKSLTDADSGAVVRWKVQPATVTTLRALHAPPRESLPENRRVRPVETTMYDLLVVILGDKLEADSDIHVVIAEPGNHRVTMIAEVPNVGCAQVCQSPVADEVGAVRAAIVLKLGRPSHAYRTFRPPVVAEVVGIGFFDFIHGQTGVAPNGIELHPLLSIAFP